MSELCVMNAATTSRTRFATLLCLAACMAVNGNGTNAHAGWWAIPKSQKSAEATPEKSDGSFSNSIRKLLKEAKAQEEQGNLDRAIALADRAAKVSEATARFSKSAADVSPSTTAKYAHDLRLKKAEQSVNRPLTTSMADATKKTDNSKRPPKNAVANPTSTAAKEPVAINPREAKPANLEIAKSARANPPAKSPAKELTEKSQSNVRKPDPTRTAADPDKPITPTVQVAESNPQPARTESAQVSSITNDDWDREVVFDMPESTDSPQGSAVVKELNEQQPMIDDGLLTSRTEEDPLFFDGDSPSEATAVADAPAEQIRGQNDDSGDEPGCAAPLRLRRQYTESVLADVLGTPQTSVSQAVAELPDSTPIVNQLDDGLEFELGSKKIIPTAAREDESMPSGDKSRHRVQQPRPQKEEVRMLTFDESPIEDSVEETQDLRQRLQSAASFEPGAVAPGAARDRREDSATPERTPKTSILRLRKRRQPVETFAATPNPPIESSRPRQPVVEHTSIVQWRPAKSGSSGVATLPAKAIEKSVAVPNDLRKSLPADSGTDTLANRSADPKRSERFANRDEFTNSPTMIAPLPPSDGNVQWMAFNESKEGTQSSGDSNSGDEWSSSSMAFSGNGDADSLLQSIQVEGSESGPAVKNGDSSGQSAAATSPSSSTLWTILGAGVFALLLAGLWVVRAAVRSNFDSSNQ